MGNYTPAFIDAESWQIINATIRRYPRQYVEWCDRTEEILHSTPFREISVMTGTGDPTAQRAAQLLDKRLAKKQAECEAVNWCLNQFVPEHQRVICLRFWGVPDTKTAFQFVRENIPLRGLRYETIKEANCVTKSAGYSEKQSRRITKRFINTVGKEIGEI